MLIIFFAVLVRRLIVNHGLIITSTCTVTGRRVEFPTANISGRHAHAHAWAYSYICMPAGLVHMRLICRWSAAGLPLVCSWSAACLRMACSGLALTVHLQLTACLYALPVCLVRCLVCLVANARLPA